MTAKALRELLEWQEYRCALTGRQLTPDNCELDHIIPISKEAGTHTLENCQIVVSEANRAKHTLGLAEFVALCRDVAAWQKK